MVYFSSLRKLDQGIYLDGDQIILKTEKEEIPIVKTEELKILGRHFHRIYEGLHLRNSEHIHLPVPDFW